MNELYTEEQIAVIRNKLSEDEYERFEVATSEGYISVEGDEENKLIIAYVRGLANYYSYEIYIRDGINERMILSKDIEIEFFE